MEQQRCGRKHPGWILLAVLGVILLSHSFVYGGWEKVNPPAVSLDWTLYGVHFTSRDEGWAVGSDFVNKKGVLLHYLNGSWVSVKPPSVSPNWQLYSVHFTSTGEGWAVGSDLWNEKGVLLHYVNGSWTSVNPPPVSSSWYLISTHFTSSDEGWAVGADVSIGVSFQGVLLHYQNGLWTKVNPPYVLSNWILNSVYLTSPEEGWAVGVGTQIKQKGVLLRRQNNIWTPFTSPNVTTAWDLTAVQFTSANEGWAVGNDLTYSVKTGILLHFAQGSWAPAPFSHTSLSWFLYGVHLTSASEGWAVGVDVPSNTRQTGFLIHYSNGAWSEIDPPDVSPQWGLWAVDFSSRNEGWAVGGDDWNRKGVLLKFSRKPEITVVPTAVSFGNVSVGSSARRKITVRNDGAPGLILNSITDPSDPFFRQGGMCHDGQVLSANEGCSILVNFTPTAVGSFSSSLEIVSNDSNESTVTVTLKARSGPADLTGVWKSLAQTCRDTTEGMTCQIAGSLKVSNIGYKKVTSSSVHVYLSDDEAFDLGDTFLKKKAVGELTVAASQKIPFSFTFPTGETASGQYVIAIVDPMNKVVEIDELNNIVVFGPIP